MVKGWERAGCMRSSNLNDYCARIETKWQKNGPDACAGVTLSCWRLWRPCCSSTSICIFHIMLIVLPFSTLLFCAVLHYQQCHRISLWNAMLHREWTFDVVFCLSAWLFPWTCSWCMVCGFVCWCSCCCCCCIYVLEHCVCVCLLFSLKSLALNWLHCLLVLQCCCDNVGFELFIPGCLRI